MPGVQLKTVSVGFYPEHPVHPVKFFSLCLAIENAL